MTTKTNLLFILFFRVYKNFFPWKKVKDGKVSCVLKENQSKKKDKTVTKRTTF